MKDNTSELDAQMLPLPVWKRNLSIESLEEVALETGNMDSVFTLGELERNASGASRTSIQRYYEKCYYDESPASSPAKKSSQDARLNPTAASWYPCIGFTNNSAQKEQEGHGLFEEVLALTGRLGIPEDQWPAEQDYRTKDGVWNADWLRSDIDEISEILEKKVQGEWRPAAPQAPSRPAAAQDTDEAIAAQMAAQWAQEEEDQAYSAQWKCPTCTYNNSDAMPQCQMCFTPQPVDDVVQSGGRSKTKKKRDTGPPPILCICGKQGGITCSMRRCKMCCEDPDCANEKHRHWQAGKARRAATQAERVEKMRTKAERQEIKRESKSEADRRRKLRSYWKRRGYNMFGLEGEITSFPVGSCVYSTTNPHVLGTVKGAVAGSIFRYHVKFENEEKMSKWWFQKLVRLVPIPVAENKPKAKPRKGHHYTHQERADEEDERAWREREEEIRRNNEKRDEIQRAAREKQLQQDLPAAERELGAYEAGGQNSTVKLDTLRQRVVTMRTELRECIAQRLLPEIEQRAKRYILRGDVVGILREFGEPEDLQLIETVSPEPKVLEKVYRRVKRRYHPDRHTNRPLEDQVRANEITSILNSSKDSMMERYMDRD